VKNIKDVEGIPVTNAFIGSWRQRSR